MGYRNRELKRRLKEQEKEKESYVNVFTWAGLKKRPLYFFPAINAGQCFILPFFSMKFLIPALFCLLLGAAFMTTVCKGVYFKRVDAYSNTCTLKGQPVRFVYYLIICLSAYIFATVFPTLFMLQELSKKQP